MSLKPRRFFNILRNRSPASESSVSTRSPAPIDVPVNHQKTRDIGKTAIQVVKESLKVVVLFSDTLPPLKSTAAGLVDILDRIDVSLLSSTAVLSASSEDEYYRRQKMFKTNLNSYTFT